jgi:putative nucleotidyltransferase with HDIG domain
MISEKTKNKIKESRRLKFLIAIVTVALIVLMFPKGESLESEVTVGTVWIQEDLIAQFTFEVLKPNEEYLREQLNAAAEVKPIFIYDKDASEKALDSLNKYRSELFDLIDDNESITQEVYTFNTFLSNKSLETLWAIRKDEFKLLKAYNRTLADVFNAAKNALNRVYKRGVLSVNYGEIDGDTIAVREGKFEREFNKARYLDKEAASKEIERYAKNVLSTNPDIVNAATELANHFLVPSINYSDTYTKEAKESAQEKVSRNTDIVNENELIVAKHNRISDEIKRKIDSYREARGEITSFWTKFAQALGKVMHIILILTLLSIYIFLFRKRIFYDNYKILLLAIVILLISFFAFLVEQLNVDSPVQFLVLVPVASILITIIFDSRIGFYTTIIVALIAGGLRGNDYVFSVMHIIAGALAAFTVRDIKNRNQIFRSFIFILTGYWLSIIAFGLERFASPIQLLVDGAFAASNALISPILAYGLIIFFEQAFKITTDLTLLELTDFNNPVLKELARKAPGTFTHSMTIGSMVESAAEDINANPLLARVGAYYHDIGKSLDPEAFVENQMNNVNIHESLKPEKSAELIIDHVNQGIELAKESKLPKEIIDFIPMHHGTMVVSYFLQKAEEELGKDNVNPDDYRYPGPRPNTKETALVMLADACESTVRSMNDPDAQKVENVINKLIQYRIEDGQLDDSPLTFKDITKIKESFLNVLIGQHHKRIRYPKQDEMENDTSKKAE